MHHLLRVIPRLLSLYPESSARMFNYNRSVCDVNVMQSLIAMLV